MSASGSVSEKKNGETAPVRLYGKTQREGSRDSNRKVGPVCEINLKALKEGAIVPRAGQEASAP